MTYKPVGLGAIPYVNTYWPVELEFCFYILGKYSAGLGIFYMLYVHTHRFVGLGMFYILWAIGRWVGYFLYIL